MDKTLRENISEHYLSLYPGAQINLDNLLKIADSYKTLRKTKFKHQDQEGTQWLKSPKTVGMMLYVDLCCESFEALRGRLDYFVDLGVNLLHLMPLLAPRQGENDGGYAVRDYRNVDTRLGDLDSFKRLLDAGKSKGIRFCIDYVVNHTAEDHAWALAAKAGDDHYRNFYHVFEDEGQVAYFETTLPQVFPKVAPGNFTYIPELKAHVMTTFYPFQWDLNFSNPNVFNAMVENLFYFANLGVDMVRLDAIPYIWKAMGTSSRNLPEVHKILRVFRELLAYVAPSVALLGEVIMAPKLISPYFGSTEAPECHVLYHASNMVALWNSIATRDARHLENAHAQGLDVEGVWMHYARCHDDIGWGLDEHHLSQLGFDPAMHKQYLIDFYFGILPDSFSLGELYEYDIRTGDARNSGTLASLAGLERGLRDGDSYQVEMAIKRILLIHGLILMRPGIPMLYSGDEIAQLNHWLYKEDAFKAHDSRWLHRVPFDWQQVDRVKDRGEVFQEMMQMPFRWTKDAAVKYIYYGIRALITFRQKAFKEGELQSESVIFHGNTSVLVMAIDQDFLLMFNLSEHPQYVETAPVKRHGIRGMWQDGLTDKRLNFEGAKVLMGPLEINILRKV